jgi:fibronectin type 3 domain-containing protein
VVFAPNTTGTLSGTITVTSNASNSPTTINVSGFGASSAPHTVTLNWTPSTTSFASFNIFRSTVSGGPYAQVNSSLTPSFTDTSVTSGQTYYYVVTEADSSGAQSIYSNEAAAPVP